MFSILIAFLPPALYGLGNVWESRLANGLFKNILSMFFYSWILNMLTTPLVLSFGALVAIDAEVALLLALSFVLCVLHEAIYFYALKFIDVSVSQALWALGSVMIPFLGAALFGEHATVAALIGFFIILAVSVFLGIDDFKRPKLNKGFYMMLLVSALFCGNLLLNKEIVWRIGWVSMSFYLGIIGFFAASACLAFRRTRRIVSRDFKTYKKFMPAFVAYELIGSAAEFSQLFVLGALPLYVKEGISNTQPFFVLLFAWLFCLLGFGGAKESMKRSSVVKKIICFVLMLMGVMLLV